MLVAVSGMLAGSRMPSITDEGTLALLKRIISAGERSNFVFEDRI